MFSLPLCEFFYERLFLACFLNFLFVGKGEFSATKGFFLF